MQFLMGEGDHKRVAKDPVRCIRERVLNFYYKNKEIPKDSRIPFTRRVIHVRDMKTKIKLLAFSDRKPFLLIMK